MESSERQLVRRCLAGERAAFDRLYDRHAARVFHLLRRLTGSEAEAEDLTQETFLAAYRSLDSWRGEGAFGAWLCGIAVRLSANARRRSAQRETEPLDEELELAAPGVDPLAHCLRAEMERRIEIAIESLPTLAREVFVLRTTVWIVLPDGDQLKVYAPLEPRAKGAPLPRSLTLELEVSPSVQARNSEYTAFFRQPITVTVPLPAQPDARDIESQLPRGNSPPRNMPLAAAIARERALQYFIERNPARALYWTKAGLDMVKPFTDEAQQFRLELAHRYDNLGDSRRAQQIYREVIAVRQQHPETHNRFAWEAQVSLRTPAARRRHLF